MIKETSAGIVLFRREQGENKFLLLHYPSGHWDFVKGKMERGETARDTAKRETGEETGITDIRFVDGFEEHIEYEFQFQYETVQKRVVYFLAETDTARVKISHEHLDYAWAGYDAAVRRVTFENAKRVLRNARILLDSL